MIKHLKRLSAGLFLFALAGCANLSTYNRTDPVSHRAAQAIFIDAKQRGVHSAPAYDDQVHGMVLKFCAEPSPDALSAIAGGASGGLSVQDKVTLQAAFTIAESASSIGLRTQSIQLMRDSMYRLCEASLSHNTSPQFWSAFRYFQNSMVTILAIEQLTGVAKAPAVMLTTTAGATPNKDVATLTGSLTTVQGALATDQADLATKKKSFDDAQALADAYLKANDAATEDKLAADKVDGYKPLKQGVADSKAAGDASSVKVTSDQKTVDAYQSAITTLGSITLTSNGSASMSGSEAALQGQAVVAEAIKSIVLEQLRGGFLRQTCATLYDQELAAGHAIAPDTTLHKSCDTWAMKTANGTLQNEQPMTVASLTLPQQAVLLKLNDPKLAATLDKLTNSSPAPKRKRK